MSNYNYLFEQFCIDNNRTDLINRWDTKMNGCLPSEVSFCSNKKRYFKCENNLHESELYCLYDITNGRLKKLRCKKCRSFAQYIINTYNSDRLEKIWNKSNLRNPWEIHVSNSKKNIILNCINDPEHIYEISPYHYMKAKEPCPYCAGRKVLPKSSAAMANKKILELWSDKNADSPYDYSLHSSHIVLWKCENNIHNDYLRSFANSFERNYRCPECAKNDQHKRKRNDLSGMIFGELKALYIDEHKTKETGRVCWVCSCHCGNLCIMTSSQLTTGSVKTCGNRANHYSKENNGNWKGGITPENMSARTSKDYNIWRDKVYSKDWYTCQCCGRYNNIEKNAHHIDNFSNNTELRFDENNGICLCKECHYTNVLDSFHNNYGTTNNSADQLEEYINYKRGKLGIPIRFSMKKYRNGKIVKPHDFDKYYNYGQGE